jgi:two-component system phosphate regulon sensor histidine kinase PhoR
LIEGSLETLEADLIEHGISTEVLQIMLRASERLRNLSTNLLLLARMENPELELRNIQLDAREVVDLVVAELQEQATQRNVMLHSNGVPSAAIVGDRDALSRMFSNLIENAIRYTPKGGIITVAGWKQDTTIWVSIEDTGIGIPPDSLPHIFDRFYRVEKARSREAGGSGLGLAIVKAIVDAHGGEITVESRVEKGTKFMVALPIASIKVAPV